MRIRIQSADAGAGRVTSTQSVSRHRTNPGIVALWPIARPINRSSPDCLSTRGIAKRVDDRCKRIVGQRPHFFIGSVLDRMGHEDHRWIVAKGSILRGSRLPELARRDGHCHHAEIFQVAYVVHTARRARPSISERLDDEVALLSNLLF